MHPLLNPQQLFPVTILLLQTLIFLFMTMVLLKKAKLAVIPFAGAEYSQVVIVSSVVFSVLFISSSSVTGVFTAFKTFQGQQLPIIKPLLLQASQYFVVLCFFELLLWGLALVYFKLFSWMGPVLTSIQQGNLAVSLVIAALLIGSSILLQAMSKELIDSITPQYLNYR